MGVNSRYDGFAALGRLAVPTTTRPAASTSPPTGTTTTSGPTPGLGSGKSLEPSGRGVTVVPLISLTADGEALLLVVRGRAGGEYTGTILSLRRWAGKAQEARPHMSGLHWLWRLAGQVRAALLWCLQGVPNGPKEVRVRVDVVVTQQTLTGQPPEVKVRVEPDLMPPPVSMLPPEVKVKVEGPTDPSTLGSTGTAPPETSS